MTEAKWAGAVNAVRLRLPEPGAYDVRIKIDGAKTVEKSSVQVTSSEDTALDVEPEFEDR